jgi:hypothetical protein
MERGGEEGGVEGGGSGWDMGGGSIDIVRKRVAPDIIFMPSERCCRCKYE